MRNHERIVSWGALLQAPEPGSGFAQNRAPGNRDHVPRPRAIPSHEQRLAVAHLSPPDEGNRDRDFRRAHDVATRDRHPVLARTLAQAAVELVYGLCAHLGRQCQGDQRKEGLTPHSSDIAEVDSERLPTDIAPGSEFGQEVDALHESIGRRENDGVASAPSSGIVTDADDQSFEIRGADRLRQAFDEGELAEF